MPYDLRKRRTDEPIAADNSTEPTTADGSAGSTAVDDPAESMATDDPAGPTVPNTPVRFTGTSTGGKRPEVISQLGDVILELTDKTSGKELRKLLVSSVVLSHASRLFSMMFSHGSDKGDALSTSSPRTVPLPDDDPNSICLICLISHLKIFQLPERLNMTEFTNFNPEDADFEKLILATHFLDLFRAFNIVTRSIIQDRSTITDIATAMGGHETLPVALFEKVKAAQILSQKQVEEALGALMNEKDACEGFKLRVGTVVHALVSGGMWPLGKQSIKKVRDRLKQVGGPTTRTVAKLCENPNCPFVRQLKQMYADIKGMCLDCAHRNGLGTHESDIFFMCRLENCPDT
ncbi:hypothetical protein COCMIDRAFT_23320 [Bipolaris oryzae ATCC 44560]|uniref:BTB domain-containing protein n=1 Tax=Bipolaris oryzae ATCC 44560 TaxID=930090 RepID=W6ZYZ4_COCMI|nr:uncharacterized protein COCMIDRAFT_23320 [Bipolaris oryzae ATCC 44560]EUC48946.1 hypothetical protein COCMIDRAFT_23320 [Bipolaris oryzae ATCC 44560]